MTADLRVLVVDDHPVNRLVLRELLSHLGCVVSAVEDGAQALSASSADHFDLVCLDRHMPGLSGDEVAERLPADQFVLAGGGFPIRVAGAGAIGAVAISGLPSRRDHGTVVAALAAHLGQDASALALAAE